MRLNILVYTNFYPAPEALNTPKDTLIIHYFVKELQKAGHRVQVVFLVVDRIYDLLKGGFKYIRPNITDYTYDGVSVHLIHTNNVISLHRAYPEDFQARSINAELKKFKQGLGWKADKIFIHFPTVFTGITEALEEGVPSLGDFHNMDIKFLNRKNGARSAQFIRRIKTWGYRNKRVYSGLRKIEEREMVRTYSGIDPSILMPEDQLRRKAERRSETMRILFAGRLLALKNVDKLVEAVKGLSFPCSLTIVGDGPEMEKLKAMSAGVPNIRMTGQLPRAETIEQMKEADVFIMLSSPETYGLVYLEAMAQGCVTAASLGEGFDGIITDHVDGFLEAPGSAEAAKRVLEEIHGLSPEQKKSLILNGYALAASMTEEKTAQRFLEANH